MLSEQLLDFLQHELDYSGTFADVMARLTDDHLSAFADAMDAKEPKAHLYFGLRRTAVERGTPAEVLLSSKEGTRIMTLATHLLTMERMQRADEIICAFPKSPFLAPGSPFPILITEKGDARRRQLEEKALRESTERAK